MCRTVHALLQTIICGVQMLVRVFMTIILMLENLIRMILQALYNFISFMLQMLSLIPICFVFLLSSKLKCFMCGGGGPCPVNRGGACDCLMSAVAIVILFFIFRATGVLDKIFYSLGYARAVTLAHSRFMATPGSITDCSRDAELTPAGLTLPKGLGISADVNDQGDEFLPTGYKIDNNVPGTISEEMESLPAGNETHNESPMGEEPPDSRPDGNDTRNESPMGEEPPDSRPDGNDTLNESPMGEEPPDSRPDGNDTLNESPMGEEPPDFRRFEKSYPSGAKLFNIVTKPTNYVQNIIGTVGMAPYYFI